GIAVTPGKVLQRDRILTDAAEPRVHRVIVVRLERVQKSRQGHVWLRRRNNGYLRRRFRGICRKAGDINPRASTGTQQCRREENVEPTKKFHALPFRMVR